MSISIKKIGAIHCGSSGKRFSGSELSHLVAERKAELIEAGCGEGSVVALIQPNEAMFFVNLFALWEIGACAVPLSPLNTAAELATTLKHSGAGMVWREGRFHLIPSAKLAPLNGTALLLYTSGTTGAPKGVMLSFHAIEKKIEALLRVISSEDLARTLCLLPVSFGHGLIGNCLPALWSGQELYLEPAFSEKLALGLGAYLDAHEITFLSSVPALWKSVLAFAAPAQRGTLRRAFCASAGLSVVEAQAVQRWLGAGVRLKNVYGITEAASWIAGLPDGMPYVENGSFGPGWDCEFKSEAGEILVRADYLMIGYHRDDVATAATLQDGWLRTGDLGEVDAEGNLILTGRSKDQINRGGLKVSPAEVEECICRHPKVSEVCVFGTSDAVSGESVGAAVVLRAGESLEAKELRQFCRVSLSEHKVPEKIFFVDALPRTARGKINKSELANRLGAKK